MSDVYSIGPGEAVQGTSINDSRRIFNFGERVAELAPQQSPFFTYLSNVWPVIFRVWSKIVRYQTVIISTAVIMTHLSEAAWGYYAHIPYRILARYEIFGL